MTDYDALVVGSGIAGMESALKLGDMGYKVLLVEKEASVGGRMILLSKVFPTLDCASCISTPKMAASIHHPNVTALTYTEVDGIARDGDGTFKATIRHKPRFVDEAACTGCQLCEPVCTVAVPDQFNADMVARRAAYITFPQAVPKKAVLERAGTSPCTYACPAGIKAHGYVSLIRSGEYEKAFQLVLEATPLVGTLGRACYAPCESECTRGSLEGTLPIRRLKRFAADRHYEAAEGPGVAVAPPNGKRVAVVGSGPAGLTAAWQLARLGYGVKILEAAPVAGGFLRLAIPAYRLPAEVVEQDISNVTAIGVEIETNAPVSDLDALRRDGFDAVLVATGTPLSTGLNVPGEKLEGVLSGLQFLRATKLGSAADLADKRVVVVGGGNVAMDTARTAARLGAAETTVAYRRGRGEMPAHKAEVDDAEHDGIRFVFQVAPVEVVGDASGRVTGLRCQRMALGKPDSSGRRRPEPISGSEFTIACDTVLVAIGMAPEGSAFGGQVAATSNGTLATDPHTLQTAVAHIFAAGDVTTGASDITQAVGQGRRAAHMIDRWLRGEPLDGFELDDLLPLVDKPAVLSRQKRYVGHSDPLPAATDGSAGPRDFAEIEAPMTEAEARAAAGDCLDCGVCSECGECVAACPSDAIHLEMRERLEEVRVRAVVVATGYKLFTADAKPEYGFGRYKNVITGMQMDRLLAPTRPFNTVLRPGDGKVPERIAYILCTGSRDETVNNPLCSRFCCMYSIKQNQLVMGALPLAEVTVHYMDIRAPGKRYDEFYEGAKAMGATYVKGRVAKITEKEDGNLILRYEDIEHGGALVEAEYDMVVLAIGVQPNREVERLFSGDALELNDYHYVAEPNEDMDPGRTNIPGVFVAGTASGAKDITDSILHAGAAVAQVAAHLESQRVPA
ncbi:MAG: FAD-dependent oxidoreductase [Candidatus Limnocylindrales bacterium]|jgi:heterodisulfide reductase subunit A